MGRGRPVDYGHCFLCIDPEQVLPGERFQRSLAKYLTRMRTLRPADPEKAVLVPGDPERTEEKSAKSEGVRLGLNVALGLRSLARELGCAAQIPENILKLPEDAT